VPSTKSTDANWTGICIICIQHRTLFYWGRLSHISWNSFRELGWLEWAAFLFNLSAILQRSQNARSPQLSTPTPRFRCNSYHSGRPSSIETSFEAEARTGARTLALYKMHGQDDPEDSSNGTSDKGANIANLRYYRWWRWRVPGRWNCEQSGRIKENTTDPRLWFLPPEKGCINDLTLTNLLTSLNR